MTSTPTSCEAAREISDLALACPGLGGPGQGRPEGGYRVELALASREEALELAERLGR